MVKLKDFILDEIPEQTTKKTKTITKTEHNFKLEYENDVDFILRRTTSKTDKSLVCIVSQGQIYIKDNKTANIELVRSKEQLIKFKVGLTPYNVPVFEKLTWKPFEINSRWINGKYTDVVELHYHFASLIKHKDTFKVLANKKLDPFRNDSLVRKYESNPEGFDTMVRLMKLIQDYIDPSFSFNSYYRVDSIFANLTEIGLDTNICQKYEEEFNALNDEFLRLTTNDNFWRIFNEYNVDFGTWLKWLLYTIKYRNGMCCSTYSCDFNTSDYLDYLKMQKEMYGKIKEKYPQYWLSEKQMLVNKYNQWNELKQKIGFELNQSEIKVFEYENENYKIVVPLMSSDIIDEANQQHHCVASYIDKISRGETHIVFIRKPDKPEESVLTVEINVDNEVCQVRGFMNRDYTLEEYNFIKEWADKTGLKLTIKELKDETEM